MHKMLKKLLISRFPSRTWRSLSTGLPLVTTSERNGIRRVVLNSAKTRNAMSMRMMDELLHSIQGNRDTALRCIVLSANGPVFSSGHNLKDLNSGGRVFYLETFNKCAELMISIMDAPVPVIACVDGIAAAAGCQLVASCDIVVATESSFFSTPGANFGIFCSTPGIAVGRSVGRKAAAKMLLTGDRVSAHEALEIGLISSVCAADKLEEETERHIASIASKSRSVIELGKRFLNEQLEMDVRSAYRLGSHVMAGNLVLADGQEGLKSFSEKRPAVWCHDYS